MVHQSSIHRGHGGAVQFGGGKKSSSTTTPEDAKSDAPPGQATSQPILVDHAVPPSEDSKTFECDPVVVGPTYEVPTRLLYNHSGRHDAHESLSQPVAGPSDSNANVSFTTGNYELQRRSRLYLKGSTTSFIDVTDEIEGVSEHPVSEGGFCDIFTANMRGEGRVALKKLRLLGSHEKAAKRFRYEAEIWFRMNHPNVLKFFGISTIANCLYMVSPWQENGHMSRYIRTYPNVNLLRLIYQVADALEYLHNHNPKIIHGDIKSSNILISPEGNALLCDFGLSMILGEIANESGVPTGVNDGGSIRYMANELMTDGQSKTEASDAYSFAMLMVEVFTGSPPYLQLRNDVAVINAVIGGKRPSYPFASEPGASNTAVEQRLWRLMQVCWQSQPAARPNMCVVKVCLKVIIRNTTDTPTEVRDGMLGPFMPTYKFVMFGGMSTIAPASVTFPVIRGHLFWILAYWWISSVLKVISSVAETGLLAAFIAELRLGGTSHISRVFRLVIPIVGLISAFLTFAHGVYNIFICFLITHPFSRKVPRTGDFWCRIAMLSIASLGSLSTTLLVTISSSNGRLRYLDNVRAYALLRSYEAVCWFTWSLLLSEIFYRLYFLVKVRRKTRKLKRVDAENNTGAMQGSGPGSGAHTIAEPDPSPPDNVIEQGGWPNVELRLQDSSPSSPLPLTEADIPMGLFSVSTNHPRTDGVGESQLESELSDVL